MDAREKLWEGDVAASFVSTVTFLEVLVNISSLISMFQRRKMEELRLIADLSFV